MVLFIVLGNTSAKMLVQVGKNATIYCRVDDVDQDGVYLYKSIDKIKVCYFYKDLTFTPYNGYKDRLETNRNLHNFSLTLLNVTKQDSNVYWCSFNKQDKNTNSLTTLLFVTGKNKLLTKTK